VKFDEGDWFLFYLQERVGDLPKMVVLVRLLQLVEKRQGVEEKRYQELQMEGEFRVLQVQEVGYFVEVHQETVVLNQLLVEVKLNPVMALREFVVAFLELEVAFLELVATFPYLEVAFPYLEEAFQELVVA